MRLRFAAAAAVTAVAAGALSGCMMITPQETIASVSPAGGTNGQVGDVQIRNVLVLAGGDGQIGTMIGVLSNTGDAPATVTLQYDTTAGTESTQVSVPANGVLSLRPNPGTQTTTQVTTDARAVRLTDVDLTPGALFPVGFSTSGADPVSLRVPVLNGSLPRYASLVPTPTASPTPEDTSTSGLESPQPSDSPSASASAGLG